MRAWHEEHKSWPLSEELWRSFTVHYFNYRRCRILATPAVCGETNVNAVERAFDIVIQPTIHTFYTTLFAGDMHAQFGDIKLTLLQTWSEDDFRQVENLIGHLVTQKRLKLPPTLFIATLEEELRSSRCVISPVKCAKRRWEHVNGRAFSLKFAEFLNQLSLFCNPNTPSGCERSYRLWEIARNKRAKR
ncbi:MAG: SecY-interacting protein Syd [Escherichia sp.]